MVEVEAIGEPVSLFRRDLFLVGVSVTACNREVSTVRGRIGEGGRSRRGGVGFGSESERGFAIGKMKLKKTEDDYDARPGAEDRFYSRRCQRRAEGCGQASRRKATCDEAEKLGDRNSPFGQLPPAGVYARFSLMSGCIRCFVSNAFQSFPLSQCPAGDPRACLNFKLTVVETPTLGPHLEPITSRPTGPTPHGGPCFFIRLGSPPLGTSICCNKDGTHVDKRSALRGGALPIDCQSAPYVHRIAVSQTRRVT